MFKRQLFAATVAGAAVSVSGCTGIAAGPDLTNPTIVSTPLPPTAGFLSWRLPKTVLETTATFKFKGCSIVAGQPMLELERSVTIVAKGVADPDLFGRDYRDSLVQVPVSAMSSWLDDRSMTVERFANGTVSKLGATVEDQTAAIAGNVLTAATKISSIAFGVPAGSFVPAGTAECSGVPGEIKAEMKRISGLLRDPATTETAAAAYTLQLADLQKKLDKLTITVTRTIDPGVTAPDGIGEATQVQADGLIATIVPTAEQVEAAQWLTGGATQQLAAVSGHAVSIFLDFSRASPAIISHCGKDITTCARKSTKIDRTTHFRDVAYIPLIVVTGTSRDTPGAAFELTVNGAKSASALPFAQFGIPRRLPINAGVFEKLAWSFAFNEFGEPTSASFGSASRGAKGSALAAAAAGSAATYASQEQKGAALTDPDVTELQRKAVRLKAEIDLAKLEAEAADMRAKGQLPVE